MAHLFHTVDEHGQQRAPLTPRRPRQPLQQQHPNPQTPPPVSSRQKGTPARAAPQAPRTPTSSHSSRPRTPLLGRRGTRGAAGEDDKGAYTFNTTDSPVSQARSARAMRVICHGWLMKQTVAAGSSLLPHKAAPRWFVADAAGLSYYRVPPVAAGDRPRLRIPWAAIVTVRSVLSDDLRPPRVDASKAYFAIQHSAAGKPAWMTLAADSREERVMWLDTLRDYVPQRLSKSIGPMGTTGTGMAPGAGGAVPPPPQWSDEVDAPYFGGYSRLCIHEEMLRDDVRTGAYYNAIMANQHVFKDKVVIDVGCGTGVLSIFCAWAGARKVFAIEASDMAHYARNIVADNGLAHVVQVVHSRAEDCELYDDDGSVVRADVIVSEWMGYFLVFEAMYESVFYCRDRWLRPEGVMFPSHSTMFLLPLTHDKYYNDRIGFWQNVYGVNMASLTEYAKANAFDNVVVEGIETDNCLGYGAVIKFIDCRTASVAEVQQFRSSFSFTINRPGTFHGFAGYFTVYFAPTAVLNSPEDVDTNSTWILSTAPFDPVTHWRQSLFFTGDSLPVAAGQQIAGEIDVAQNVENRRYLDVTIHWSCLAPTSGRGPAAMAVVPGDPHKNQPQHPGFAHTKRFGFA